MLKNIISLMLMCHVSVVASSERLALSLGSIAGDGWSAGDVTIALDLVDNSAQLRIGQLQLPAPLDAVHDITAACTALDMQGPVFTCRGGRFQLEHAWLDAGVFNGDLSFDQRSGDLSVMLSELPVAGGTMAVHADWQGGKWQLDGKASRLDLARLKALAMLFTALPAGDIDGRLDARFKLRGQGAALAGQVELDLQGVSLASEEGNIATEDLALQVVIDVQHQADHIRFVSTANSRHGQIYVAPIFIDAATHPFDIKANGRWNIASKDLHLTDLRLDQPRTLLAEATLRWQQGTGLQDAHLLLHQAVLPNAYAVYAQPFLIGTAADSLLSSGRISGTAHYSQGRPQSLRLALADIDLVDDHKRFTLNQLDGVLHWQAEPDAARASSLHWQAAALGPVALGAATADLQMHGDNIRLLQPLRLPILNGALNINTLHLTALSTPHMTAEFNADLTPISLGAVSSALGWPELSGTIAGRLPTLRYENGQLALAGRLDIEAFDGRIHVDDLQLSQPFGMVPRLSANIGLERLDLKTLTEAFSFGRIEGQLSGRVDHLRLVNWQPASFAADFYTPPDDSSRHRISQRAIENLSSIGGGGAAAVLSRGFLRFFKDFAYDRIGLSCRLQQNVCLMGGIGPADHGGYYIVRGKLLPRVDVIGFQHQVSWPTLIEQLKSVMQSEGPLVR
jgi:hypothetical protein